MTTALSNLENIVIDINSAKCPYAKIIDEYWPEDIEKPYAATIVHDNEKIKAALESNISLDVDGTYVTLTMKNGAQLEYILKSDIPFEERNTYTGNWEEYLGSYEEQNGYEPYYEDRIEEMDHARESIGACILEIAKDSSHLKERQIRNAMPKKRQGFIASFFSQFS